MRETTLTLFVKSYIAVCARCAAEEPVLFSEIARKGPQGYRTYDPAAPLEVVCFSRPEDWSTVRAADNSRDYDVCEVCTRARAGIESTEVCRRFEDEHLCLTCGVASLEARVYSGL